MKSSLVLSVLIPNLWQNAAVLQTPLVSVRNEAYINLNQHINTSVLVFFMFAESVQEPHFCVYWAIKYARCVTANVHNQGNKTNNKKKHFYPSNISNIRNTC